MDSRGTIYDHYFQKHSLKLHGQGKPNIRQAFTGPSIVWFKLKSAPGSMVMVDGRTDDDGRTTDYSYTVCIISSPCEPNGSGELKDGLHFGRTAHFG